MYKANTDIQTYGLLESACLIASISDWSIDLIISIDQVRLIFEISSSIGILSFDCSFFTTCAFTFMILGVAYFIGDLTYFYLIWLTLIACFFTGFDSLSILLAYSTLVWALQPLTCLLSQVSKVRVKYSQNISTTGFWISSVFNWRHFQAKETRASW